VSALEAGRAGAAGELELRFLVRSLRGEGLAYARARAEVLLAGLCAARGDTGGAVAALDTAERAAGEGGVLLEGAVAAWLRGHLSQRAEHAAARARAEVALSALGVCNVRRFSRVVAPGFERYLPADATPSVVSTISTAPAANR
jgi:hypothetical protein